ncbi:MAG TPA: hypothetical protein VJB65_04935, partial [Patescibacteria group bacterium]|nr:hypothetical protein [Patescibacteria group bacterium]
QESYEPQEGTLVIDRLLRGQHEFVTYIKNETLYAQFDLIDMNREFNDDIVSIEVYSGRTLIHTAFLSDDGINDARAQASVVRSLIVDIPNLPEGAYSLKVITSSDDVVISRIETFQHLFVAKGKLFLINNVEYQSILPHISTNSSTMYAQNMQFSARTDHPSGLQTIFVDDEELSLETVSQTMYWSPRTTDTSVLHTVTLPKNDVILYSNGYFAFAKEHFFDPDYLVERLSETTTLDALDYILYTNYQQAEEGTRNRTQQIHIDLNQTTVDRKQLTFVLSAPGIDRRSATLMIQRVQFDFHREPLLKRLLQKFK